MSVWAAFEEVPNTNDDTLLTGGRHSEQMLGRRIERDYLDPILPHERDHLEDLAGANATALPLARIREHRYEDV